MLISVADAQGYNQNITQEDIFALEQMIINRTNNHFHVPDYEPAIELISGGKVYIEGFNFVQVDDTVELTGVPVISGFYHVTEVGEDWLKVDIPDNYRFEGGKLFLIRFPADVVAGVKHLLEYQAKTADKIGIKSESISRWTTTYESFGRDRINGLPAHLFNFLEPYVQWRWG